MKKKLALLLAVTALATSCFVGCNPDDSDDIVVVIDPTKTQLYVANFDGGVGSDWLTKLKKSFEEDYAEVSFEEGKMGAQLILDTSKANHVDSISTEIYNVIFAEGVAYNQLAASDKLLDISDIVTETNTDGKTIESKLTDHQRRALTAVDGNYYALPHYEYYPGVTYDKAVFNRKQLYMKQGGGWTNASGKLSAGPDGKSGTVDDGLPATHEELLALCDQMVKVGVTPFIYTGMYEGYMDMLLEGLMVSYLGRDQLELAFSFDSSKGGTLSGEDLVKAEVITGWNGNTPIVEEKTITTQTGYLTSSFAGKYYALEFVEKLVKNKDKYFSEKINSVLSHMDAQEEYIMSDLENEPIGMLIEGSFWYNEAQAAFGRSVDAYGEDAEGRDFAWMPLPTKVSGSVTEENGGDFYLVDETYSYGLINANIKDDPVLVNLAKTFLQYAYTDEKLQEFTTTSGCYKGLNYTLTKEQYDGLDNFYKSITDLRGDGTNVVRPISDNKIYLNSELNFKFMHGSSFGSHVNGKEYLVALTAMKSSGISAKDYFEGMRVTQSTWNSLYSKYFN